ncbi:putative dimethylaniline monooxygenase [Talaromyces proteolyticus]|uniref:Dimethylaniline monooxygenase n=1 Tax=Talaromyces proteolyticus TaxID=1131652 RepID=A0AAD4KLL0_9EURO|nr:putative dimethylaniline monooxygenase [Talaromyces proteolyticus]KAH8695419.1 putative dimethylaniline monooxygenase [Talaromyces proteolyticus]
MTIVQSRSPSHINLDALIIGAGFSGIYLLHKLRDELKLSVKIFEAKSDIGGTWHANRYPGARVDCPAPLYAYSSQKVWKSWTWGEKYPNQKELKTYFDHVDKVLNVRKDCFFNSEVNSATYDEVSCQWTVHTVNGKVATAKYLVVAVGFASKSYVPDWKGIASFKGTIYHSAHWPEGDVVVKGKKVAIIGTGSTGIQITQEWAKEADETFLFQRTPNLCLPMRQQQLDAGQQSKDKGGYEKYFVDCQSTFAGLDYQPTPRNTMDDSPTDREAFYERLYELGGFRFWFNNYQDLIFNTTANREAYEFWARKTRSRITDPIKRDLLAPLEPPHPFGAKRPSLEQDFYEQVDKPNVHIIDTKSHPIVEVRPEGIVTADGKCHEVDIIAVATGFDAVTGGLMLLGLKDTDGIDLCERWKDGMSTYLGMAISGFPNMFLSYSLQAPTAFANGPTIIELQGNWITSIISRMESEGVRSITATKEAESSWNDEVNTVANATVLPLANSWYMGSNIPGKPVQSLNYIGGLPTYRERCDNAINRDFLGFVKN